MRKMALSRVEELFGSRANPSLVLAPMVRAGTLPLRLLALHHGAQTTWSEELIAQKLKNCRRVVNNELGTVDFVTDHGGKESLVYQTCAYEEGRNILQIGASNAEDALAAARVVAGDVSGVDLNCGCPQHFSISGGMGAALLSKPCVTAEILSTLRRELPANVTVSCKIRLLDSEKQTVEFIERMIAAGADAITVHARRVPERPRDKARWDELEAILQTCSVPVVVNGDVFTRSDRDRILSRVPSASGAMVARGAISDVSNAFRGEPQTISELMRDYLAVAELCTPSFPNCKWFASQVIRYRSEFHIETNQTKKTLNEAIARSKTIEELLGAFSIDGPLRSRQDCWGGLLTEPSRDAWTRAIERALSSASHSGEDQDSKRLKIHTD